MTFVIHAPPPFKVSRYATGERDYYRATTKLVTSGGAHLRGLAPGQHSSEETSQQWRAAGNTVPI